MPLRYDDGARQTEELVIRSSKNWKRETSGLLIVVLILGFLWTEGGAQMTEVNMGIATLKFEDVADPTIIEKLEKNGFIDSLYK
jgi:hypothetical protein